MQRVPLDRAYPGLPTLKEARATPTDAKVSTLSNGVRIATIDSNSAVTHIGIFIDSGTRYEPHELSGISHFLEKMAFKSTLLRSEFGFCREMSALGSTSHANLLVKVWCILLMLFGIMCRLSFER